MQLRGSIGTSAHPIPSVQCYLENLNSATRALEHLCHAMSNCLTHDTAGLYTFQETQILDLK
jgi:hypothetical protein